MARLLARKMLLIIPMLLGMTIFLFLILQLPPGSPAQVALGDQATPQSVANLQHQWGLDEPLYVQIGHFVGGALRGDLGLSFMTNRPVTSEILRTFPATFELSMTALVIAVLISTPLGILAASKRGSIFDTITMIASLAGFSVPVFVSGLIAILVFSHYVTIFPVAGRSGPLSLVLPAVTLSLPTAAELTRMMRSSMLDQMGQDYLRTARAKGLASRTIMIRHTLKNALIPVVTLLGLRLGALLAGTVVTETIFAWPGLGRLLLDAILARDYPLIRGGVLFIAVVFVLANLLVDITYGLIDPRIRYD